jgi:hypothetical protein
LETDFWGPACPFQNNHCHVAHSSVSRSSKFVVCGWTMSRCFFNTSELLSEMSLVVFAPVAATVTTTADPHASVYLVAKVSDVDG